MVAYACNPITWEVEVAESRVQGYPLLDGEFEVSLGYVRQYLIATTITTTNLENKVNFNILTLSLGRGIPLLIVLYLVYKIQCRIFIIECRRETRK